MCGVPVATTAGTAGADGPRSGGMPSWAPWAIAGLAVVGLGAALIVPRGGDDDPPTSTPLQSAAAPAAGDPSGIDLTSMTPREAADRLFNRVMTSVSTGDTAQARAFTPMAIAAYERAVPLDLDGRYHMATLHIINAEYAAAGAQADSILAEVPTHLYGLFTAAQVASAQGDSTRSLELFQRFLANYDTEVASNRTEYLDHRAILPAMRQEALASVDG